MMREERHKHAVQAFHTVELPDWRLDNQQTPQGGQSGVCTVTNDDGTSGVFRCLTPEPDQQAIDRFKREVTVLNEITHSNVMTLLKFSLEAPYW